LTAAVGIAALSLASGCGLLAQKTATARPSAPATAAPSPSTALPDLCNLITDQEIGAIANSKIDKHAVSTDQETVAKHGTGCVWSAGDQQVLTLDVYAQSRSDFDEDASAYPKADGVGEAAYTAGTILYAFSDGLNISCIGPGEDVRAAAIKKAIEKLRTPASPSPSAS
jgi:hypothetical protein